MIDLRSDTVTKPTPAMIDAMMNAEVGDDVFESDPTVNLLQEKVADYFGKESALYCPSGTMTNQIAMRISTVPQDEIVCDQFSHVYLYEGGGMMSNSMISPKLLSGDRGRLDVNQLREVINPDDVHFPRTRLVALENTMNKGGGSVYEMRSMEEISAFCKGQGLNLHLDGARYFNAQVKAGYNPKEIGKCFDTISICFSKGLGAPVGSVLIASAEKINQARRVRKVFGGGMRQAGYLAAACIYALDHHIDRLAEDHRRAQVLANVLAETNYVDSVFPVETNIVIAKLKSSVSEKDLLDKLSEKGIGAVGFGKGLVRFVTHLDFSDDMLDQTIEILKGLKI